MMNSAEPPSRTDPDHVLTRRQCKIVQVIEEYSREHGCSPSNREITGSAALANSAPTAACPVVSQAPAGHRGARST